MSTGDQKCTHGIFLQNCTTCEPRDCPPPILRVPPGWQNSRCPRCASAVTMILGGNPYGVLRCNDCGNRYWVADGLKGSDTVVNPAFCPEPHITEERVREIIREELHRDAERPLHPHLDPLQAGRIMRETIAREALNKAGCPHSVLDDPCENCDEAAEIAEADNLEREDPPAERP